MESWEFLVHAAIESSRDPSSRVHVSPADDATEVPPESCLAVDLKGEPGERGEVGTAVEICRNLSSELIDVLAVRNLDLISPKFKPLSPEIRRASNRAALLKSCNVLLFSRAPLVAKLVVPVLPDAPVSALRQVYVVPEMVLPRLCVDVLLLIREDVVDEGCASLVSTRPRADLAAMRLECFLDEDCDDCDILMGC